MKLYANVESERATKGQGGNDYLKIKLQGEDKDLTGSVLLEAVLHIRKVDNGLEYALIGMTKTPDLFCYLNSTPKEYKEYLDKNNIN